MKRSDILIGFDLDGVIIDHTQNKIRFAARYGVTLTPEETHSEVMRHFFSPSRYREIKNELYDRSPESLNAPLMEGAYAALSAFMNAAIPFVLISMQKNPMHATRLLERGGLWGTYFNPENCSFVADAEAKEARALSLGVTHFIDDEPYVLDHMGRVPTRILFDQRDLFPDTSFTRVRSWSDVTGLFGVHLR